MSGSHRQSESAASLSEAAREHRFVLLGRTLGMITHEINNLLTPIIGRCEMAMMTRAPHDMQRAVEESLNRARQAQRVMVLLLDYARGVRLEPSDCQVAASVDRALASMARPLDKDNITLRLDLEPDAVLHAQPLLLEQLLLNLLLNARRALKDAGGGTLTISAQRDGDHVHIAVADNARGMTPDIFDRVIRPRLTGDGAGIDPGASSGDGEGIGLGLSICRTIAEAHGAALSGTAQPGGGCAFALRWPAAAAAPTNA